MKKENLDCIWCDGNDSECACTIPNIETRTIQVLYMWTPFKVISENYLEKLYCINYEEWGLWEWVRKENCDII